MYAIRKLKPDRSIGAWIIPLIVILIFGIVTLAIDMAAGFIVLSVSYMVLAVVNLVGTIRTSNFGLMVACAFDLYFFLLFLLLSQVVWQRQPMQLEWQIGYFTGALFFGTLLGYMMITKRIKWRGREILELAAEGVETNESSYTSRPRPVGKVKFGQKEILAFARFASRNLLTLNQVNPQQVTLVPVRMGQEYSLVFRKPGTLLDATWISFGFDGSVAVHISHKDYLDYMQPPDFDKLCQSLGDLFIEFAEMHQRGEGSRIIDRLDALNLSFFS